MAGLYAIAAVSAAIKGVLDDALIADLDGARIEIIDLADYQKGKPVDEGISICLYRAALSGSHRGLSMRQNADGSRQMPPLPIDLHYLLTAWGKQTDQQRSRQQWLLGWMMRTLEDFPTLNAGMLNFYGGKDDVFAEDESVSLIADPLALQDFTSLWDIMKPNPQVTVAYVARMVYLETTLPAIRAERVQTRVHDYARMNGGR